MNILEAMGEVFVTNMDSEFPAICYHKAHYIKASVTVPILLYLFTRTPLILRFLSMGDHCSRLCSEVTGSLLVQFWGWGSPGELEEVA